MSDVDELAAFGEIEIQTVSRIQQLTGQAMSRAWSEIPHVTHNDEADITDLEARRRGLEGVSLLACEVKAAIAALQAEPRVNGQLLDGGRRRALKKYFNIGVAVDTPNGLLVPVVRDADRKDLVDITSEIALLAEKAGGKGLPLDLMSGGCFTISSLGKWGGGHFTPIIRAPELAILGVGRTQKRLALIDGQAKERLILPLSLSYDHRAINGVDAGRFMRRLTQALESAEMLPKEKTS